ncbi:hypothetical protein [Acinetobacter brisouii]|uniref:hypothetical protein n=1 Tax=Acinetobacter brisouii TaxID=396323 RepID=UPI00208FCDDF|nr:hypothetical protein [Acinetobacter brisouii]
MEDFILPKQKHLRWMGDFYANNFTFDHYEILTIANVPKKERKIEASLMTTKWHDYRLMHPMMATYYFYHLCTQAYRKFWASCINSEQADHVHIFKKEGRLDFLKARESMSIWRLRQLADTLGIRYEFFLNAAFSKVYRMQLHGRIIAPRPSMLRSEELTEKIQQAWSETCEASLQISCSPYFKVSNYIASKAQIDHEQFVIDQIKRRKCPHYALAACLYQYEVVRIETALACFDETTVRLAISASNEISFT